MARSTNSADTTVIDPERWGVSFSTKQCWNMKLNAIKALDWLLDQGFRRFRIMSYWQDIEKTPGKYDFAELDRQFTQIADKGGVITLSLGARQPRWPESHYPDWALELSKQERDEKLIAFVQKVVKRYHKRKCLISYQLENEALLNKFGDNLPPDRNLLIQEYAYIKAIDPNHPIIMTTSDTVGIPTFGPIPDEVGFSFYTSLYDYKKGKYHSGRQTVRSMKIRSWFIKKILKKNSFIHELQLEPWGPMNIWEMSVREQSKSMSPAVIKKNIARAKSADLWPIDLWGAEWWYRRSVLDGDTKIWRAVNSSIRQN